MTPNQGIVRNFERKSALLFTALILAGGAASALAQSKTTSHVLASDPASATASARSVQLLQPPSMSSAGDSAAPAGRNPFQLTPTAQASATTFDRADANKDGQLSAKEAATLPPVGQRFKQLDTDQSGRLSRQEFEKGARF